MNIYILFCQKYGEEFELDFCKNIAKGLFWKLVVHDGKYISVDGERPFACDEAISAFAHNSAASMDRGYCGSTSLSDRYQTAIGRYRPDLILLLTFIFNIL